MQNKFCTENIVETNHKNLALLRSKTGEKQQYLVLYPSLILLVAGLVF